MRFNLERRHVTTIDTFTCPIGVWIGEFANSYICTVCFRKRKGSPLPGSSSASGAGRGRRKQKATTAKAAVTDADEASGSSEEGTSAAHVASRGMFSDYFNKASSSSRSSSVARYQQQLLCFRRLCNPYLN